MKCENMQPNEIRVIRLAKDAILGILQEIIGEIGWDLFKLPHSQYSTNRTDIGWHFDEKRSQIIIFAYKRVAGLDREALLKRINMVSDEAIDSLLISNGTKKIFHTIINMPPADEHRKAADKGICCRLVGIFERTFFTWTKRNLPLKKHEIRVIRVSKVAIQELLWEYFVEKGNEAMNISAEDSLNVIFHMYLDEKLEETMLYALNLKEFAQVDIDKMNSYCRQNIPFIANAFVGMSSKGQKYVSVMLAKQQGKE